MTRRLKSIVLSVVVVHLMVIIVSRPVRGQTADSASSEPPIHRASLGKFNLDLGVSVSNQFPVALKTRLYWQEWNWFGEEIQVGPQLLPNALGAWGISLGMYWKLDSRSDNGTYLALLNSIGIRGEGITMLFGLGYQYSVSNTSLVNVQLGLGGTFLHVGFDRVFRPAIRLEVGRVWKVLGNDFR